MALSAAKQLLLYPENWLSGSPCLSPIPHRHELATEGNLGPRPSFFAKADTASIILTPLILQRLQKILPRQTPVPYGASIEPRMPHSVEDNQHGGWLALTERRVRAQDQGRVLDPGHARARRQILGLRRGHACPFGKHRPIMPGVKRVSSGRRRRGILQFTWIWTPRLSDRGRNANTQGEKKDS